mgnify:CR=1 FL=1
MVALIRGDVQQARSRFEEALTLCEPLGKSPLLASIRRNPRGSAARIARRDGPLFRNDARRQACRIYARCHCVFSGAGG